MAGAGYKLFATGDVLTASDVNTYLMQQTVMVFANAAARTTALSGVVAEGMLSYLKDTNAVEVYDGANWVASDDPNAIQNTIVDAKGDLITATGADVPARLAVGSNGDTLVADSAATTGLRWQNPKTVNYLLNSNFGIWQRGTSFTNASTGTVYGADRWQHYRDVTGSTFSRQTTSDSTNLPFIQYCMRAQRDSGNSATNSLYLVQSLESAQSIPLAGKTVVISFYARAGANYSATSSLLKYLVSTGTGTDQNRLVGYTGNSNAINTTATLTTTWQRFQATATLASTATEAAVLFQFDPTGTAGANDYFEVTGVQLEIGSVATPFQTATGTIQGELAACQRYYIRFNASSVYTFFCNGNAYNTTQATCILPLPVTLRTAPSSIETTGTASNYRLTNGATATACNSVPALDQAATQSLAINFYVASGLTAGQAINASANNTASAYIGVSAEL
jgi:hypothetical protein